MKKLIIASLALVFFSAASFAQSSTKKSEPSKAPVMTKAVDKKEPAKMTTMSSSDKKAITPVAKTTPKAPAAKDKMEKKEKTSFTES